MSASLHTSQDVKRAKIAVSGVVQGVGFRPFVYRLAHTHGLHGSVRNTSGEVEIEIEGEPTAIDLFIRDLTVHSPPLARIAAVQAFFFPPLGIASGFAILESLEQPDRYQPISPDIATCDLCRAEIFNHENHRYGYPFTNCTNCGPRFTIIDKLPYDRPHTTMAPFPLCGACEAEYRNPLDRRFHAQPNACPVCGPQLQLTDNQGRPLAAVSAIAVAADLLRQGHIIAVKGLGGFQLACDATNATAVRLLRERKKRPAKPFAVMVAGLAAVEEHCLLSAAEAQLLASPEAPIVLLRWRHLSSPVAGAVAPGLRYLGLLLPYTPLHHLLLAAARRPLIMTSGNISGEPIARDNGEALEKLAGIADYFLLHDRDIRSRYDDSVFMVAATGPQPIRRARGYAPAPIALPFPAGQILACGAEEKSTFCLTRDCQALLSQHIGDLENANNLDLYEKNIHLYMKLFRIEPQIIAHDLHPDYLSTRFAQDLGRRTGAELNPVQHHHAHILSCLADNGWPGGKVIGVAFDGTGYGPDGTIWGGEFLVADSREYERVAHLECVPLPGGAAAIRRPYRAALGYLFALLGPDCSIAGLPIAGVSESEQEIIVKQIAGRINAPLTSSAGRLFDSVAALLGLRSEIEYEAQAAIDLQMAAEASRTAVAPYPFHLENGCIKMIRLQELLAALVADIRAGADRRVTARRFHVTMAEIIAQVCGELAAATSIRTVALSGGVFQNRLLLKLTLAALAESGLTVLTHRQVPCNDGGLALGQAVAAHNMLRRG